jgi:uncharacterized membrane protein YcaP (DUF421 family)
MDLVIRGAIIYLFLLVILRVSGNRQFSELTAFDAVLIIIISETTQQALVGDDFSMTASIILVTTLVGLDVLISLLKRTSRTADSILEGVPVLLVDNGRLLEKNMHAERVDEEDILTAARLTHGLERMDQVKYAVLERGGSISIIPAAA